MGFQEKPGNGFLESEPSKKWVIAGISSRGPVKSVYAVTSGESERDVDHTDGEENCCPTTPTGEESRIPTPLTCPPAPRKKTKPSKCHKSSAREFSCPPDLETVFMRHVERVK